MGEWFIPSLLKSENRSNMIHQFESDFLLYWKCPIDRGTPFWKRLDRWNSDVRVGFSSLPLIEKSSEIGIGPAWKAGQRSNLLCGFETHLLCFWKLKWSGYHHLLLRELVDLIQDVVNYQFRNLLSPKMLNTPLWHLCHNPSRNLHS